MSGSVRPLQENSGTSQATFHEIADNVRLCALPLHESSGTSRALCNPVMKFADSVRLRALPLHESGGTLCAPHDEIVTNLT